MKTTVLEVIDAEGYLSVIGKRGGSTDKGTNQSRAKTRKVTESRRKKPAAVTKKRIHFGYND